MTAKMLPAVVLACAHACAFAGTTYTAQTLPEEALRYHGVVALLNDGSAVQAHATSWGSCPAGTPFCVPPMLEMEMRRVQASGAVSSLPNTQVPPRSPYASDYGVAASSTGAILFQARLSTGISEVWKEGVRTAVPAMTDDDRVNSWSWISAGGALLGVADTTLHLLRGATHTTIPAPSGTSDIKVAGINTTSNIAVTLGSTTKPARAALWNQTSYKVLPFPLLTLYRTGSRATALNDAGDVVGAITNSSNLDRAALWRKGWSYDLGTLPGYTRSTALAVSSSGVVLACAYGAKNPDDPGQLFTWEQGTRRPLSQVVSGLANPSDIMRGCTMAMQGDGWQVYANQKGEFLLPFLPHYVVLTPATP